MLKGLKTEWYKIGSKILGVGLNMIILNLQQSSMDEIYLLKNLQATKRIVKRKLKKKFSELNEML
jgi:hypothetical protein